MGKRRVGLSRVEASPLGSKHFGPRIRIEASWTCPSMGRAARRDRNVSAGSGKFLCESLIQDIRYSPELALASTARGGPLTSYRGVG